MRTDFPVQVLLDVHALDNGLDDEIAVGQLLEVVFEVARGDELAQVLPGQRGRLLPGQFLARIVGDPAALALVGRQVVEINRNAGGGQVGSNLCPHHPGTQHRGASYLKLVVSHGLSFESCESFVLKFAPQRRRGHRGLTMKFNSLSSL